MQEESLSVHEVCDYIIIKVKSEGNVFLPNLKLQKLLYYTQAWYLAFYGKPLFKEKFQAWIHGPVNREIFDRFKIKKILYSDISIDDVKNQNVGDLISQKVKTHIESILETYASFTGAQLEYMTHNEEPWLAARNGIPSTLRCDNEIDEQLMESYYKARLDE